MTWLPKTPYSDKELELFSRLQLRTSRGEQLQITLPDEVQVKDHVRTMKQMPPWQQILAVELRLPNLMCDTHALRAINNKATARNEDVMGQFLPNANIPQIAPLTITWGGTMENRPRTRFGGVAPDLTYLHESGHRVDMIVGTRPAAIRNRVTQDLRYFSSLPVWSKPVHAYVREHAGASHAGDGPKGKPLYTNARSLMNHLCFEKADGTPHYSPDNHPGEAMAELLCGYSTLYTRYQGHHRAIAQELNSAYPTLWKPLHHHVIAEATAQAERLYARRESLCRTLHASAAAQSHKNGEPFDALEASTMLRLLTIQHGMDPLDGIARKLKDPRTRKRVDTPDTTIQSVGKQLDGLCTPTIRKMLGSGRGA